MFRMPLMFWNKHFYFLDTIFAPARAAGTARTTPALQNDRKLKFEEQKSVFVYSSGWECFFLEFGEEGGGERPGFLCSGGPFFFFINKEIIINNSMFWMPFKLWNKHFLCSGCHLSFEIYKSSMFQMPYML